MHEFINCSFRDDTGCEKGSAVVSQLSKPSHLALDVFPVMSVFEAPPISHEVIAAQTEECGYIFINTFVFTASVCIRARAERDKYTYCFCKVGLFEFRLIHTKV